MTELETRTLARASILLLLAAGARWGWEARRPVPLLPVDSSGVLPRLLSSGDSAREEAMVRGRPLAPGERLDPNRAPTAELDRLPGVGPAVARALVESREREGPFRSAADLARVRGVGPATAERLAPFLAFGGAGEGGGGTAPGAAGGGVSRGPPTFGGAPAVAGGRRGGGSTAAQGGSGAGATPLDLNRATAAELEELPGVGPALAARIVALRSERGAFRSVDDLLAVRGIGPATLRRLRGRVRVR